MHQKKTCQQIAPCSCRQTQQFTCISAADLRALNRKAAKVAPHRQNLSLAEKNRKQMCRFMENRTEKDCHSAANTTQQKQHNDRDNKSVCHRKANPLSPQHMRSLPLRRFRPDFLLQKRLFAVSPGWKEPREPHRVYRSLGFRPATLYRSPQKPQPHRHRSAKPVHTVLLLPQQRPHTHKLPAGPRMHTVLFFSSQSSLPSFYDSSTPKYMCNGTPYAPVGRLLANYTRNICFFCTTMYVYVLLFRRKCSKITITMPRSKKEYNRGHIRRYLP